MRQSLPVHHLLLHCQTTGGSASGSAEHLTFHHSPGGHEMRDVQQRSIPGAGRGAWTMPGDAGGVGVRSDNAAASGSSA